MRKTNLLYWFIGWFAVMLLIGFLTQPSERPSKLDVISFETTESAELYFKNVRSFYYHLNNEGEGVFDAYRLTASLDNSTNSSLVFVIYNMWRQNMAFIRLDTNYLNVSKFDYLVSLSANGIIDTLHLPDQLNESQFIFARDLYLATRNRNQIALISRSDSLWISESEAVNLRKTLRDYFKLVGKL